MNKPIEMKQLYDLEKLMTCVKISFVHIVCLV